MYVDLTTTAEDVLTYYGLASGKVCRSDLTKFGELVHGFQREHYQLNIMHRQISSDIFIDPIFQV